MKIAIYGASGATGQHVLDAALKLPYNTVIELGRRTLGISNDKLRSIVVDFEHPPTLKDVDVVISTLSAQRTSMSFEEWRRIDHDYTVESVRELKDTSRKQRLVYCSAMGANPSSWFDVPRSKGETERDLTSLGFETIIFRPSVLYGANRARTNWPERIFLPIWRYTGALHPEMAIEASTLGTAMAKAGLLGIDGLRAAGVGQLERIGGSGGPPALILSTRDAKKIARSPV